jgi:hypothetical protein
MELNLSPELLAALTEQAQRRGVAPDVLVMDVLQHRFLPKKYPFEPRDDWERRLFNASVDCGVSLPHSAFSREEMYD